MKSRLPVGLNAKDRKALHEEIRRQCIKQTAQYEAELDVVVLFTHYIIFSGLAKRGLNASTEKCSSSATK